MSVNSSSALKSGELAIASPKISLAMHTESGWPLLYDGSDRWPSRLKTKGSAVVELVSFLLPQEAHSKEANPKEVQKNDLTDKQLTARIFKDERFADNFRARFADNLWNYRDAELLLANQQLLPSGREMVRLLFLGTIWLYPANNQLIVGYLRRDKHEWYPGFKLLEPAMANSGNCFLPQ